MEEEEKKRKSMKYKGIIENKINDKNRMYINEDKK